MMHLMVKGVCTRCGEKDPGGWYEKPCWVQIGEDRTGCDKMKQEPQEATSSAQDDAEQGDITEEAFLALWRADLARQVSGVGDVPVGLLFTPRERALVRVMVRMMTLKNKDNT